MQLVRGIPGLVTARLPVEFGRASDVLGELIAEHKPDLVIAVGLAEDRTAITPERVAINLEDARIPDNAGARPLDSPVDGVGPAAYLSTLPVKGIVRALIEVGIPAQVSLSAGTYVCNSVMYRLLHESASGASASVPVGFVHVPPADVMDVATIARGLEIAVRVSLPSTVR